VILVGSLWPSWQCLLLNWILRLRRKPLVRTGQIAALRQMTAKLDRRIERRLAGRLTMRRVELADIEGDWIPLGPRSTTRVLLYLHGGAYCLRSPWLYRDVAAQLARMVGADAFIPDYRLAPEHPHPAAVNDCFAAYRYLLDRGYAPHNIAVVGDSAGGALALSLLLLCRTNGLPQPACAALMSPGGDWTLSAASFFENADRDVMFRLQSMLFLRKLVLVNTPADDATASPVHQNFDGFPPLHLVAAEREMMRDIAVLAAERAHAAGVEHDLRIWRHPCHAFPLLGFLPEAQSARRDIASFINRHFDLTIS
jgi:acetyl esterase/lipase